MGKQTYKAAPFSSWSRHTFTDSVHNPVEQKIVCEFNKRVPATFAFFDRRRPVEYTLTTIAVRCNLTKCYGLLWKWAFSESNSNKKSQIIISNFI